MSMEQGPGSSDPPGLDSTLFAEFLALQQSGAAQEVVLSKAEELEAHGIGYPSDPPGMTPDLGQDIGEAIGVDRSEKIPPIE